MSDSTLLSDHAKEVIEQWKSKFPDHLAAWRPSSTQSAPIEDAYNVWSLTSTVRSDRITGMPARFASFRTPSQPVSFTGENAMTSTSCTMKERMALIWFSCFPCASENCSVIPRSFAVALIDSVLALRHSLSAPIWLKPTTSGLSFPSVFPSRCQQRLF